MIKCTKDMYERMRRYAQQFNSNQDLRYPFISVMPVNDYGECAFCEADRVVVEVYELPSENDYSSIVDNMQRELNLNLNLMTCSTFIGTGCDSKSTGLELEIDAYTAKE